MLLPTVQPRENSDIYCYVQEPVDDGRGPDAFQFLRDPPKQKAEQECQREQGKRRPLILHCQVGEREDACLEKIGMGAGHAPFEDRQQHGPKCNLLGNALEPITQQVAPSILVEREGCDSKASQWHSWHEKEDKGQDHASSKPGSIWEDTPQ